MDPRKYDAREWTELAAKLDTRQMKRALKGAYRTEAAKVVKTARRSLATSGLQVKGNKADWQKGIRPYVYSRGGGFMVTVKPGRGKNRTKSMHRNRQGLEKPVLMFAEDGTTARKTKTKTKRWTRARKGHATGRMPAYGFLQRAQPEMYRKVEEGLLPQVEKQVRKAAARAGFQ